MLDPLNNLNTPCALALFLGSMDTTAKRPTRVRSYPYRLQFPVAPLFIARVFSALVPQDLGARPGGNMIGPCDEGDATRRGQPVKSTLDPLEPTIDVALNDLAASGASIRRSRGRLGVLASALATTSACWR